MTDVRQRAKRTVSPPTPPVKVRTYACPVCGSRFEIREKRYGGLDERTAPKLREWKDAHHLGCGVEYAALNHPADGVGRRDDG